MDFRDRASYSSRKVNAKWTEGAGWLPIGFGESPFEATLDGNGHSIPNLFINRTTDRDDPGSAGLFGVTNSSSIIMRTGLSNVNVTGRKNVGGLVGKSGGTITDSYVTGSVSGRHHVGGLIGSNYGEISDSNSVGEVSGGAGVVGGLVGWNWTRGEITDSHSTSSVSGGYNGSVGGLVGSNVGTFTGSYATANITGDGYSFGGLVGSNGGTIIGSYATCGVSGKGQGGQGGGGLVGDNQGTISGSYATGDAHVQI